MMIWVPFALRARLGEPRPTTRYARKRTKSTTFSALPIVDGSKSAHGIKRPRPLMVS